MNGRAVVKKRGGGKMEMVIFLGFLAVWIVLQAWLLPRLGVKT